MVVYTSDPSIHEAQSRRLPQIQGHLRLNDKYLTNQSYVARCCLKEKQGAIGGGLGASEWVYRVKAFFTEA